MIISLVFPSCKKDEEAPSIKITTDTISLIARTSAEASASIINESSDSVIARGFCWSTEPLPTFIDKKVILQDLHGKSYNWRIHGLMFGTTYYIRAYAITCSSKIYGNQVSFTTKPATVMTLFNPGLTYQAISDIDGNSYKTIKIGTQEWMAENLKTTRLNDGTAIRLVSEATNWDQLYTSPGYCWYENNEEVFKKMYGAYYNWYTVKTGKLCPAGWHVPHEAEWKTLKIFLGMTPEQADADYFPVASAGTKIKEAGTHNWVEGSIEGTNESGFTALPGGNRTTSPADFGGEGLVAVWWGAGDNSTNIRVWSHLVFSDLSGFFRSSMGPLTSGFNVRCIKD
jgi:uncharacterized protein (TIGR02145 family)